MLDREPFLLAIAADPGSDLPRLQFADWLDDRGEHDLAELIRLEGAYLGSLTRSLVPELIRYLERRRELLDRLHAGGADGAELATAVRGLFRPADLLASADDLLDQDGFRRLACERHPHWYGADRLTVTGGRIVAPAALETILSSPVTARVTRLVLAGREEVVGTARDEALGLTMRDFVHKPVVTPRMVEHLCGMREARRLVALDLRRNDLDNDALRALARSTNLIRLRELELSDGNPRVRGRVWSQVVERFGPEVVR